jgi:hypothetical protein
MTIDEAIQKLLKLRIPLKTDEDYKNHEALRMAIGAFRHLKWERNHMALDTVSLLPGETRGI